MPQKLVEAAPHPLGLASLSLGLLLDRLLYALLPDSFEVGVVSSSPLAPGELARPSAPGVRGFGGVGIADVLSVSRNQRPLAAREVPIGLEGPVGPLGLVFQPVPEFLFLLYVHTRIVHALRKIRRPSKSTHHDSTYPPPHPHLIHLPSPAQGSTIMRLGGQLLVLIYWPCRDVFHLVARQPRGAATVQDCLVAIRELAGLERVPQRVPCCVVSHS